METGDGGSRPRYQALGQQSRRPVAGGGGKAAKLSVDQRVRVSVEEGRVVITPIAGGALSLEQRLALFDPARHGEEVMAAEPLGAERP